MRRAPTSLLLFALAFGCGGTRSDAIGAETGALGGSGGGGERQDGALGIDASFGNVARLEPAFGGLYIESGKLVLVLTDTSRLDSALLAVEKVFGTDTFAAYLPARAVEGRFNSTQLNAFRLALRDIFLAATVNAVDIDESRNRLAISVTDLSNVAGVELRIAEAGVPREAVIIEQRAPVEALPPAR